MVRILPLALAALLLSTSARATTPARLCEAAKLGAASKFSACRTKADSIYAKSAQTSADRARRDAYRVKCDDGLVKAYASAELRYGASCPSAGDVDLVRGFLAQCSADVADATGGGAVPDYVADLATCRSGTATAADVAKGKTFSGGAGLGIAGTASLNGLMKTGQTTSYGPASDGAQQRGASQSFTDNGDGTVTDERTGLVWEKKSDDGSIHDWDDTYTWGQTVSPFAMNGTAVTVFLAALNTPPCFAGSCDWRIPNVNELFSLNNWERSTPSAFAAFDTACTPGCTVTTCSCTRAEYHWSSTTSPNSPGSARCVGFLWGAGNGKLKDSSFHVRAVRGGS